MAAVVMWRFTDGRVNWAVYTLGALGVYCGLLAVVAPRAVQPVYVTMMLIAIPIGFVLSSVLMRLIYYLLFTPIALWFKVSGRDAMDRRIDPSTETYWRNHRDQVTPRPPASYLRLY